MRSYRRAIRSIRVVAESETSRLRVLMRSSDSPDMCAGPIPHRLDAPLVGGGRRDSPGVR